MDVGEVRAVDDGACADIYLVETGMYGVSGYGCVYIIDADRPAIVETGMGANDAAILDALHDINLRPSDIEVIAVTHVHLDHAGGAGHLADACPHATVYAHHIGAPHLVDPEALVAGTKEAVGEQWKHYAQPRPVPDDRVMALDDGDTIDLGDRHLTAYHAPGHAPHQIVYHLPSADAVFTGDAAGIWIPERATIRQTTPPPQFDLDQAVADLEIIRKLDPRTLLYTHFGPAQYEAGMLDEYERTLAEWIRDVDTVSAELGDDEAVIAHFVEQTDLGSVWNQEKAKGETRLNVQGALTYLGRIRGET